MTNELVFPVFLKLKGRRVLVVGRQSVIESKIPALVEAGAQITVVSTDDFGHLLDPQVVWIRREFRYSDLDGQWYVVAGADPKTNRAIFDECNKRQTFLNMVDDRTYSTAYLGGIIRRDGYVLSLSSSGQSPAVLRLLREGLEHLLPSDLGHWTRQARNLRNQWKRAKTPHKDRVPELFRSLKSQYTPDSN